MTHYSDASPQTSDKWSGYERVRVDVAETSFFEGREFRAYYEFNIAQGQSKVIKVVAAVPFILHGQRLLVDDGKVRFSANTGGGTEGGSFTAIPVTGKNRMPERRFPYYEAQNTLSQGGTYTGGTEVEVIRVAAASANNQATTVGGSISDERGLPAGTYYLTLTNYGSGTATGTYDLWWEERSRHAGWYEDELTKRNG